MSVGRVSTFLDIYIQRDLDNGTLTEEEAQELIDHMVMKFRMVKFARIPSYNELFSGDPVWATLNVGGKGVDGRSMVTKNDFRFLHTLENMGPSPEPNLTVFTHQSFLKHSSVMLLLFQFVQAQFNTKTMTLCVLLGVTTTLSAAAYLQHRQVKKCSFSEQEQTLQNAFFTRSTVVSTASQKIRQDRLTTPITSEYLDYDEVMAKYDKMMDWLAGLYVNVLNLIQYMHDKYYYEASQMALIDTDVRRTFATGIAGFSHVVDSLSAIKYAKVKTIRDENGLVVDFETTGDFPKYGNDDDRADDIAVWLLQTFMKKLKKHHTYRESEPTTSILTITSNVVYGKLPVLFRTEEKQAHRFHLEQTQATVQNRTDFLLP